MPRRPGHTSGHRSTNIIRKWFLFEIQYFEPPEGRKIEALNFDIRLSVRNSACVEATHRAVQAIDNPDAPRKIVKKGSWTVTRAQFMLCGGRVSSKQLSLRVFGISGHPIVMFHGASLVPSLPPLFFDVGWNIRCTSRSCNYIPSVWNLGIVQQTRSPLR